MPKTSSSWKKNQKLAHSRFCQLWRWKCQQLWWTGVTWSLRGQERWAYTGTTASFNEDFRKASFITAAPVLIKEEPRGPAMSYRPDFLRACYWQHLVVDQLHFDYSVLAELTWPPQLFSEEDSLWSMLSLSSPRAAKRAFTPDLVCFSRILSLTQLWKLTGC